VASWLFGSVVCNACVVAKRYVLPENCPDKQIGLPDGYPVVPSQSPVQTFHFPNGGINLFTLNTCVANKKCYMFIFYLIFQIKVIFVYK